MIRIFSSPLWRIWTEMKMFTGSVWGAWLGLLLMLVGFVLTLPMEGGRLTPRFLLTTISAGVLFWTISMMPFVYSVHLQIGLAAMLLVGIVLSIRQSRGFGAVSALGELLLGYGALLVFRSLFAAVVTILALIAIHWVKKL